MVSVIMSIYNEELRWIDKAIKSILYQTYKDIEIIIIIDNPNINKVVLEFLNSLSVKRNNIKIIVNKHNLGLAMSLNKGIAISEGEFIARMDADDISDLDRIRKQVDYLLENKLDLVSTNKINIDENDEIVSKDKKITKDPNKILQYSNIIVHSSVLIKSKVLKSLGGYRNFFNSEDLDLWLRLTENGYKIGILDEPLVLYRIRSNSASVGRQLEQFYVTKYIIALHYERVKNGYDSFSEANLTKFIESRNLSESKKEKCFKASICMNNAVDNYYNGNFVKMALFLIKGLFYFPELIFRDVSNFLMIKLQ